MPDRSTGVEQGTASESVSPQLSARRALVLVGCYFAAQALLRVLVSDSVELDESEQVLCSQVWRWGYGSSPPLYTWLQILTFQVLGTSVLALALVKNLILFAAFFFTYLGAKAITGNERVSVVAMLSLLLFPQITWESQRDLTHSVLATALAAATFYSALRVLKSGHWLAYLGLGICVGLGILTKSSYWLLALALAAAALTVPSYRRRLTGMGGLLTLTAVVLISGWYFQWMWFSPDVALRRSQEIIRSNRGEWLTTRVKALISIVECVLMLGGVLAAVFWVTFRRPQAAVAPAPASEEQTWLERTGLILGCISVAVALSGIELRERWFQPVTFLAAIWAVLLIRDRLTVAAERKFLGIVAMAAGLVLVILPGIPLSASVTHRPTRLNAPYARLSQALKSAAGEPGVIVAASRWLGGNLRFHFQSSTVLVPEFHALEAPTNVSWLVVWDATKAPAPPPALSNLVANLRGVHVDQVPPAYVEESYQYTVGKRMKLGYIRLPENLQAP